MCYEKKLLYVPNKDEIATLDELYKNHPFLLRQYLSRGWQATSLDVSGTNFWDLASLIGKNHVIIRLGSNYTGFGKDCTFFRK